MDQSPLILEPPPAPASAVPAMSLPARMLNVFAIPGAVFAEIKASPHKAVNWLVPALIASISGALGAIVVLSQPAILQKVHEQQTQMIETQVQSGRMTHADAERTQAAIKKIFNPTVLKIAGAVGATIGGFVRLFWWGLVLWLLGRWFLKVQFGYLKAVEVAGLASMIAVLGMVVTMLLVVNFGKLTATPNLALAISEVDMKNKGNLLLGAMNVFNFWLIGVLAVGLARLAGVPFVRAAFLVMGYWIMIESLFIITGLKSLGL